MKINNIRTVKTLLVVGLCSGIWANNAMADDDVAALVIDNGTPLTSVPEPATWSLILVGAIGIGLATRRNRKNK